MSANNWPEVTRAASEGRYEVHIDGSQKVASASNHLHEGELPQELFQLTKLNFLEVLHLPGVTLIPPDIGKLTHLTQLSLHYLPHLTQLPVELNLLKSLKYLNLSYNALDNLPSSMLDGLVHLDTLNLSNNALSDLPDLSSLEGLQKLNLAANRLTKLPESLTMCHLLSDLNISHNQLIELPDCIGDMSCLKELNVEENRLREVNPHLALCGKLKVLLLKANDGTLKDNRLRKLIADNKSGTNNNTSSILQYLKKQLPSGHGKKNAKEKSKSESHETNGRPVIRVVHSSWKPTEAPVADGEAETSPQCQALSQCESNSVRPYVLFCVLKNVRLGQQEDSFRSFLRYQDDLHKTMCHDRKLATIATHDHDKVVYPLLYTTKLREQIRIQMLTSEVEETGLELIHRLCRVGDNLRRSGGLPQDAGANLYAYAQSVRSQEYLAVVEDALGRAISLPPITNCEYTKLTEQTCNILLEVTGTQHDVCKKVADSLLKWVLQHQQGSVQELLVEQIRVMDAANPGRLKIVYPSRADFREVQCNVVFTQD